MNMSINSHNNIHRQTHHWLQVTLFSKDGSELKQPHSFKSKQIKKASHDINYFKEVFFTAILSYYFLTWWGQNEGTINTSNDSRPPTSLFWT